MRNPFISIVVPTYNRASFIRTTIESLLNQQYESYEIIVVDDGSTDNTEDIVKGINSEKVSYHKKKNAERGAARNYGARLAKGDYVNFFDSDDVAYSNHVSEGAHAIQKLNNPEVFHLGYDVKDAEGKVLRIADVWPATINERLIDGNHLSCNGIFVRKDICLQFPFSEIRELSASEDYELWLRLASRFPFHCVSTMTSTVVNHEARSVLTINAASLVRRIHILQEHLTSDPVFVRSYGKKLGIFRSYLNIYIALHLAMSKAPKTSAMKHLVQAVSEHPAVVFSKRFLAALKTVLL